MAAPFRAPLSISSSRQKVVHCQHSKLLVRARPNIRCRFQKPEQSTGPLDTVDRGEPVDQTDVIVDAITAAGDSKATATDALSVVTPYEWPATPPRGVHNDVPDQGFFNEAVNGRAAMLGWVINVITEWKTQHSVLAQLFGRYVDEQRVQAPVEGSVLMLAFVVVLLLFASAAPVVYNEEKVFSRSNGVFTPKAERWIGRLAMLGFVGVVGIEWFLLQNSPIF